MTRRSRRFVPILYPASVHEYLEYGLKGWALSRYSGLWVAFKGINETLAQTATIDLNLDPSLVTIPEGGIFPPEGVHFLPRSPDPVRNDRLIKRFKIPLAHHFAGPMASIGQSSRRANVRGWES